MDGNIIDASGPSADLARDMMVVRASGLLDAGFYAAQAPELPPESDAVTHFSTTGWRDGRKPNPYFDPKFYYARNPDIAVLGLNPLVHYIEFGDREGRDPSQMFHVLWYRETYGIPDAENALADYLARRRTGQVSPVPVFDAAWYLEHNPDVAATMSDPFEHFCAFGVAESRDPAPGFDIGFYRTRYAADIGDQNPLLHYLAHRGGRFLPCRPAHERLIAGAVRAATRPSPDFESLQRLPLSAPRQATLLAYYLPQFHPIPENDAWWGQGFTDWTNLARATPRFAGHYQPRVPRDLGYYSLDDPATLPRQIDLARAAGIGGFVFYYYWFNGRRLLEKPLERLLADPALDTRFCLMWANENWTRRWDGLEREIMLAQDYRAEDDIALIDDFARHFADKRYIRLDGRPLLMIYRAALIPDGAATISRWRALFAERHGENPLIFMAQSFHDYDPARHGLDGAVEFPPHKLVVDAPKINAGLDLFDPEFSADVYRYDDIAAASLAEPDPSYPLIRTAVPGWDNDPRREGAGVVLHDVSPAAYQAWLAALIERARCNPVFGEPIVCINAWNEWAEGAYLEPDLHFGGAFLNATGRAATGVHPADTTRNVLLVGHDALAHGAQMLLLHLARHLRRNHGITPRILLLGGGPMIAAYEAEGVVDLAPDEGALTRHIALYRERGIACAIVNSTASARICRLLADIGIPSTLLIHEMPRLIQEKSLRGVARQGMNAARAVVFSSNFVRDALCAALDAAPPTVHVLAQGNYQEIGFTNAARAEFRVAHGIKPEDYVVLGVGFADLRKGFDLFLQIFRLFAAARADVHFIWMGEAHLWIRDYLGTEIAAAAATGQFHLLPFDEAIAPAYAAADIYALTSREDPLPTTVIEAMAAGVPSIAFEAAGGIPDLQRETATGSAVPPGNVAAFAVALAARLDHAALEADRPRIARIAAKRFDFAAYTNALLGIAHPGLVRISCAVLSYNYRDYLAERLGSVFGQTYPAAEVLLLDDASTDDSVAEAQRIAADWRRSLVIHHNQTNSGSVLAQWRRAATLAAGDFLWLAEADDAAEPRFLARLADALSRTPDAVMAVADSRAIDSKGRTVMEDYQRYYIESEITDLAHTTVFEAQDFAARFLARRNLILNVSAVIFRRTALLAALERLGDEIETWRLAGDWRAYLELLAAGGGSVVWLAEPLNVHRRHDRGITQALDAERHLAEIARMQDIAAERLGLDDAARQRQSADRAEIALRFGVAKIDTALHNSTEPA
ncbi:glycoside hydrolase family 99-like domain-containing protein [Acidiphilium sp. AL]|uniref:Glycoside hydrolase family 99-like domain-containing protein n=1 Tax=Acidiphilium iwatense TaxID=768198 RepID=A0ABS9DTJ4_9PROT|nr:MULTISPECIES: glycoside hydrolase family 99-like domain-containing protein [Acidiphilium]MCF3946048.1 glycoside hydrolase family 99-like domain-containing protein [Acidiphilium iwatense]MCU4159071.1 glycoside hydrolase family 99-like domain-containing protein [Acidiphilium sp. AL]